MPKSVNQSTDQQPNRHWSEIRDNPHPDSVLYFFKAYCEEKQWNYLDKMEELKKLFHYKKNLHLYPPLNNTRNTAFKQSDNPYHKEGEKRNFINHVRLLHLIFKVPYERFGFEPTGNDLDSLYFPMAEKGMGMVLVDLELKDPDERDSYQTHSDSYKNSFVNALSPFKKMKHSLRVYDYLEKENYKEPEKIRPYTEAHERIYKDIEKTLVTDPEFEYTRFLSLPVHYKQTTSQKELTEKILNRCSVALVGHICRCIKKHQSRWSGTNNGFFMVGQASMAYSWGIVDQGRYLLSEYYHYRNGKCYPEVLFVEENTAKNKVLKQTYSMAAKHLLKPNPATGLLLPRIYSIDQVIEALNDRLKSLTGKLDEDKKAPYSPDLEAKTRFTRLKIDKTEEKIALAQSIRGDA